MNKYDIPNLFDFATKELSHDAFYCWLAECINSSKEEYNNLGKNFISLLRDKVAEENSNFKNLNINDKELRAFNQKDNVDIILEIYPKNTNDNDFWVILIENKINSTQHSNQLVKYKNEIRDNYESLAEDKSFKLNYNNLGCIYLRPKYQSNYLPVLAAEYSPVHGDDIKELLQESELKRDDSIVSSYYNFLDEKLKEEDWFDLYRSLLKDENFRNKILSQFSNIKRKLKDKYSEKDHIIEYIDDLNESEYDEMIEKGYFIKKRFSWVNNLSGGFSCFWFGNKSYEPDNYNIENHDMDIKFQFESYNNGKKMRVGAVVMTLNKSDLREKNIKGINEDEISNLKSNVRKELWKKAQKYDKKNEDNIFKRPDRFGHGKFMTFAVLSGFNDIELNKVNGKIDKECPLLNAGELVEYEEIINKFSKGVDALQDISENI